MSDTVTGKIIREIKPMKLDGGHDRTLIIRLLDDQGDFEFYAVEPNKRVLVIIEDAPKPA